MRSKGALSALIALGLGVMGEPGGALGTIITFAFAGDVTSVSDVHGVLQGRVQVGDTFNGIYTFDSTTPDRLPELAWFGSYEGREMWARVGDFLAIATPLNVGIGIINDDYNSYGHLYDGFGMGGSNNGPLYQSLSVGMGDSTASVFTSDALPIVPPDLSRFDYPADSFRFWGGRLDVGGFTVEGTLTSLQPEPGSLVLLCLAGAALCRLRRPR